jgi:hypothetical protein
MDEFLCMSKCCKSDVEMFDGETPHYVCKKCGKPCDLYFDATQSHPNENQ